MASLKLYNISKDKEDNTIKTFKKIVTILILVIASLYLGSMWVLSVPAIQHRLSRIASDELSNALGTKVTLQRVHIRPMDRIVLDEVSISDQQKVDMLQIERLAVQYDFFALIQGKINIHSAQLFSPKIHLIQDTISGKMNYDFLLKLFNRGGNGKAVHLRLNSLLIRRGEIQIDPRNVSIRNLATRLSIKTITEDSVDVRIKSFSLQAQHNFEINNLKMICRANRHGMRLRNFGIELPHSAISSPSLSISYDSLPNLTQPLKWKHLHMSLTRGSHLTPIDLQAFVPKLQGFTHPWTVEGEVEGNAKKLNIQGGLHVPTLVELAGEATLKDIDNKDKTSVVGSLTQGVITKNGLSLLAHEIALSQKDSTRFTKLGRIELQGRVYGPLKDCTLQGKVQTLPGNLDLLLQAQVVDPLARKVTASISSDSIAVGTILNDTTFGNAALDISVQRTLSRKTLAQKVPNIDWTVQGDIHELGYKSYIYRNITVDISRKDKHIQGELWADDPNGTLWINGGVDMRYRLPKVDFEASLKDIHLDRLHLSKREEALVSTQIELHCQGLQPDSIRGTLQIPLLRYSCKGHDYLTKDITLSAQTLPDTSSIDKLKSKLPNRHIQLKSDFLHIDLDGHFVFKDAIAHLKNQLLTNLSSLYNKKDYAANNLHQYKLYVSLDKSDFLQDVLNIPVHIQGTSTLNLSVDERKDISSLATYIPRVNYGTRTLQSINIKANNSPQNTFADIRFNNIKEDKAINVVLHTEAQKDTVLTAINWGNNTGATYSGRMDLQTILSRQIQPQAITTLAPTQIIIQDSIWQITPATVTWRPEYVDINGLRISHKAQLLAIHGTASHAASDSILLQLHDMDLKYIFNMVNLKRSIDFGGMVTGYASMANTFNTPHLNADLFIKNYSYNNAVLGNLNITGLWNQEKKGIHLQATCHKEQEQPFTADGYIYPLYGGGLDLGLKANGVNIAFMQHYLSSISNDIQGQAWGNMRIFGPFHAIDMEGDLNISGEGNIDILGTRYKLGVLDEDTTHKNIRRVQSNRILLTPGRIETKQFAVYDLENHPGTVDMTITHDHLHDMAYDVRLETPGMLVLDTQPSDSIPFSGHIYASGSGRIYGHHKELRCEAGLRGLRGSTFDFALQESESAYDAPFITFRDARTTWNKHIKPQTKPTPKESDTDIYMDIQVDATPDVQMKLVMDPQAEDNIVGNGSGNIRLTYYNKGNVNMYGKYTIQEGRYDFNLQEVIHKTFDINKGSSITFDGDPLQGNMDIQATYVVNGASLNDLGSDVANLVDNPNVRVNCLLNLKGAILSPEIDMDIALPNERAEIEHMIRNYIGTDEQMDMQIIYLLSLGKFYTQLAGGNESQNSNMVTSVISSTLSGQLNSMISGLTNNHWNFGTNLSTGQEGWTDMEIEGMLSGRLLNNRLLINGNFGYRENPLSESNFVGDFDVQYLLNRNGGLILKAYNKTNDHYYTRNSLTTQGLGIVFQKDFNNWNWLWFWKKKKKNVSLQTKVQEASMDDSLDAYNETNNDDTPTNKTIEGQSSTPNLEFDFIQYEQSRK